MITDIHNSLKAVMLDEKSMKSKHQEHASRLRVLIAKSAFLAKD